jgi:Cdc6-like AAA superfamily ATPase
MRVYVSSTSVDLRDHRAAVLAAIRRMGHQAAGMEDYGAEDRPPLDRCLEDVASCDVYVGIFAWRYGYVPEGHSRSITELEYRRAVEEGIPTLVFLADEEAPWPRRFIDRGADEQRIEALREELGRDRLADFFTSPDDLSARVSQAIARHVQSAHAKRQRPAEVVPRAEPEIEQIVGLRPADVTPVFRGRQGELEELRRKLGDPTVRFVCVVGRPGIGKTALLTKVCEEIESGQLRLPGASGPMGVDGITYLTCTERDRPTFDRIFNDVAQTLGKVRAEELRGCWQDPSCTASTRARALLGATRGGCYLLVVYNFETALRADGRIADPDLQAFFDLCLTTRHGLRLVATSRRSVALGGQGLRNARTVVLESGLSEDEAVALLRELDHDGELGLRDAPEEVLRRVVARCFGIPRALETVAVMLQSKEPALTVQELLREDALFDERVVGDLAAERYSLVGEEQQRVLEALSVYGTPVHEEAVASLLEPLFADLDAAACLRSLVRSRLVTYRRAADLYELHPLDRQYAYDRIPEGSERHGRAALHERAAAYYFHLAEGDADQETALMAEAWQHLLRADVAVMRRCLEQESEELSRLDAPVAALHALRRVLSGYVVLAEHSRRGSAQVARAVAEAGSRMLWGADARRELLALLYDAAGRLFWMITGGQPGQLCSMHADLLELCRLGRALSGEHETAIEEQNWLAYANTSTVFLKEHGHDVDPQVTADLLEWLRSVCRRVPDRSWALEMEALTLETHGEFTASAQISEKWASRAEAEGHRQLAAALLVRAGRCWRQAGNSREAAYDLVRAGDLLTRGEKLSIRAADHYGAALELEPALQQAETVRRRMQDLSERLAEVKRSARATVALLTNEYDADFADALCAPLADRGIACSFRNPEDVDDLAGVVGVDGIALVGGIGAHGTGRHVRQCFYDAHSCREATTFGSIELTRGRRTYCDFWRGQVGGRPARVLAGDTRVTTSQAVLDFIESDEFGEFSDAVLKHAGSRSSGGKSP